MNIAKFAAGLILVGAVSPAAAQSVPQDVRCLMISNLYAQASNDQRARQVALESLLFFTGRLDGRADARTITNTMRAQAATINPATSAPEMNTCNQRVARSRQAIQVMGRAAAPPAAKK